MLINKTANNKKEVEMQRNMNDIYFMMRELEIMSHTKLMTRYKTLIRKCMDNLDELFYLLESDFPNIKIP